MSKLRDINEDIDGILNDEMEAFDNLPETIQIHYSERGQAMQDAIGEIENAFESISDAIDALETAKE